MTEQAIAARLTAIAEQAVHDGSKGPGQIEFEIEDTRFLLAHVETLTQQVADSERLKRIMAEQARDALAAGPQF